MEQLDQAQFEFGRMTCFCFAINIPLKVKTGSEEIRSQLVNSLAIDFGHDKS